MLPRRQQNMRPFEDDILCHIYVAVSTNPIIGNSQPGSTFWNTIASQYNEHPDITVHRGGGSLQSRFSTISQQVMLYASKIVQISNNLSLRGSGTNENDWINQARGDYYSTTGKQFNFDNCYQILKDLPKFNPSTTRMNTINQQHSMANESDTASLGSPSSMNMDSPIDIESPSERPPGRKGEKAPQKRKTRVSNIASNRAVVESVDKFNVQYSMNAESTREGRVQFHAQMDELINIRKDELKLKLRNEELKLRMEEDAIMRLDTRDMSGAQQQYYQMRMEEIMRKRMSDNHYSGPSTAPM